MNLLIIFILIVLFFFVALFLSNRVQRKKGVTQERETPEPILNITPKQKNQTHAYSEGCCGAHEFCEQDSLIATFADEAEYFDDEELDRFKLKNPETYSDSEVEEFREVFYSVLDDEKPRWIRSLQIREISIPEDMKDEIAFIINDIRKTTV